MASSSGDDPAWLVKTCERIEAGRDRPETADLNGPARWQAAQESTPVGARAKSSADNRQWGGFESSAPPLPDVTHEAFKRVKMDLAVGPASFMPTRYTHMVLGRPVQVGGCPS